MFQINNMTQMSCNFREQSKIVRTGGIPLWEEGPEPSQATLIASPLPPAWPVCHVVKPKAAGISCQSQAPRRAAKDRGEGGVIRGLI